MSKWSSAPVGTNSRDSCRCVVTADAALFICTPKDPISMYLSHVLKITTGIYYSVSAGKSEGKW